MSSPKSFKRYASQWLGLFDEFKDRPGVVHKVHCPDEKAARALRLEFYKAREAFIGEESMRGEYEAALNARELRVEGTTVVFDLKDNNWIARLLEESLRKE